VIYAVEKTSLNNPITSNLFATFHKISDPFYDPLIICGEQAYIVPPLKMQFVYEYYLKFYKVSAVAYFKALFYIFLRRTDEN
jgi:hypothetical protein